MSRMAITVMLGAFVSIGLVGCSEKDALEDTVKTALKDPDSAKFRKIDFSDDKDRACVEVNAKNALGGYTGFSSFALQKNSEGWELISNFDESGQGISHEECKKFINRKDVQSNKSQGALNSNGTPVVKPEPGQYKATIVMTGIEIPGMPAGMAGHGAGMTTTTEYCLTKEQVANGFEEMMKRGQSGECSYERFNLNGEKIDAVMVCKTAEGTARMTMDGTATPTTSDFTATMAMNFDGAGDATMKFDAKHERIGDCPAK